MSGYIENWKEDDVWGIGLHRLEFVGLPDDSYDPNEGGVTLTEAPALDKKAQKRADERKTMMSTFSLAPIDTYLNVTGQVVQIAEDKPAQISTFKSITREFHRYKGDQPLQILIPRGTQRCRAIEFLDKAIDILRAPCPEWDVSLSDLSQSKELLNP